MPNLPLIIARFLRVKGVACGLSVILFRFSFIVLEALIHELRQIGSPRGNYILISLHSTFEAFFLVLTVLVFALLVDLFRKRPASWPIGAVALLVALLPFDMSYVTSTSSRNEREHSQTVRPIQPAPTLDFRCEAVLPTEPDEQIKMSAIRNYEIEEFSTEKVNGYYLINLQLGQDGRVWATRILQSDHSYSLIFYLDEVTIAEAKARECLDGSVLTIPLQLSLSRADKIGRGILRKNYGL